MSVVWLREAHALGEAAHHEAGAMMANGIWNITNPVSGVMPWRLAALRPRRNAFSRPPSLAFQALPSPKARP
jgi:hypothetical protein